MIRRQTKKGDKMKKLLILALLMLWSCEGFGVFKHDHDGICGVSSIDNDGQTS